MNQLFFTTSTEDLSTEAVYVFRKSRTELYTESNTTKTARTVLAPPRQETSMSVKVAYARMAFEYNRTTSLVYPTVNATPILTLFEPMPGGKIINFGRGTGEITLRLSEVIADPRIS